jgi:hypothetical protein
MRVIVLDSHFNVLKNIDWPKLTIITLKEFARQLDNAD